MTNGFSHVFLNRSNKRSAHGLFCFGFTSVMEKFYQLRNPAPVSCGLNQFSSEVASPKSRIGIKERRHKSLPRAEIVARHLVVCRRRFRHATIIFSTDRAAPGQHLVTTRVPPANGESAPGPIHDTVWETIGRYQPSLAWL
jgi:hypothetical protein